MTWAGLSDESIATMNAVMAGLNAAEWPSRVEREIEIDPRASYCCGCERGGMTVVCIGWPSYDAGSHAYACRDLVAAVRLLDEARP